MSIMETRPSAVLERSLRVLREREAWLHAIGVVHAAAFGAVARRDDDEKTDVDVLVELSADAKVGTPEMLQIEQALAAAIGRSVDIVSRGGLQTPRHDHVLAEMVPAF